MGNKNNKRKSNNYKSNRKSTCQAKSKSANHNKSNTQKVVTVSNKAKPKEFPSTFPFWARFKPNKNRTTLVIKDFEVIDKNTNKSKEYFVHREATHTNKNEYEKISPNPDKSDPEPMYLKRPAKKPKKMFAPHNKELTMPEDLKKRYEKYNKK